MTGVLVGLVSSATPSGGVSLSFGWPIACAYEESMAYDVPWRPIPQPELDRYRMERVQFFRKFFFDNYRTGPLVRNYLDAWEYYLILSRSVWVVSLRRILINIALGVFLATLIATIRWAIRISREFDRAEAGKCLGCGYSLTGSNSGVCPECGLSVAAAGGK
jgi:hypothetical protein